MKLTTLILPALLALAPSAAPQDAGEQDPVPIQRPRPEKYMGRAFVFRADLQRARALGWIGTDEDEEEVLDQVTASLWARVRQAGRFTEAQVAREEDRRFSVTFVGRQDARIEAFLQAGLAEPGRFAWEPLARAEDLAAAGVDPAAERGLLEAWRASHPDQPLVAFNRVVRDAGGPHPALRWVPDEGGEPRTLVREPVHRFVRGDLEKLGPIRVTDETYALALQPKEKTAAVLDAFVEAVLGRELALVVDDVVVGTQVLEGPLDGTALFDGAFTLDELRPLLFSLAGEPLRVPLVFEEFSKRELKNVAPRGS